MAQFDNIVFVKGDCLKEDGMDGARDVMSEVDSVVHMVGSITDSFNYKKVLQTFGDFDKMQNCAKKTLSSPQEVLRPERVFEAANWLKDVA